MKRTQQACRRKVDPFFVFLDAVFADDFAARQLAFPRAEPLLALTPDRPSRPGTKLRAQSKEVRSLRLSDQSERCSTEVQEEI
jgi:hypothetical protein